MITCQSAISGRGHYGTGRNVDPASVNDVIDREKVIADMVKNVAERENFIDDRVNVIAGWENIIADRESLVAVREQVVPGRENAIVDKLACQICLENETNIICIPCKHMCVCSQCLDLLKDPRCPVCRQYVQGPSIVYLS